MDQDTAASIISQTSGTNPGPIGGENNAPSISQSGMTTTVTHSDQGGKGLGAPQIITEGYITRD